MNRVWRAALLLALLFCGCSTVPVPQDAPRSDAVFPHGDWHRFLQRHVDEDGQVGYAAAATDRADLDRYLATLAARSPDSHPDAFPTAAHRLAYWINAYNAWVIATVLANYPIDGVRSVTAPRALFFAPKGTGFFLLQRISLGGRRTSLYALENRVIRGRFEDPRIHFALNCASASCPRLPREAFDGVQLESQLNREAHRFVSDPRYVSVDRERRELRLSSIFEWYRSDFTDWLERFLPDRPSTLASYVSLFASEHLRADLARCARCDVVFEPYDWSLNERREPAASP
ncbi:MAG: DUF547 domain-containing protein [Myxococcales bacterium]|nr:DUF547 domain-containing protein [Myxococcales bacterium]